MAHFYFLTICPQSTFDFNRNTSPWTTILLNSTKAKLNRRVLNNSLVPCKIRVNSSTTPNTFERQLELRLHLITQMTICIANSPKITTSQKHFSPTIHQSSFSCKKKEKEKKMQPSIFVWAGLSLYGQDQDAIHQEMNLRIWRVFQALNIYKMTPVSWNPWKLFGHTWIRWLRETGNVSTFLRNIKKKKAKPWHETVERERKKRMA